MKLWRGSSGCYLAVVNDYRAKLLASLSVVEGPTGLADLHQQSLPLGQVLSQAVVDVLSLHVPQALVLQPHLEEECTGGRNMLLHKHSFIQIHIPQYLRYALTFRYRSPYNPVLNQHTDLGD